MEKPADTDIELQDLIRRRWSPRAFADRPVEEDKLLKMLEAARWAPSCFNEQPWHFITAARKDEEEFQKLLECLSEKNRRWAKNAPLLMLTVTKLYFEHNRKDNRHAYHDIGLAVENMVIQAMELGIFAHQMAGFSSDAARQTYGIPEGFDPVTAIALGYPGDSETLPPDLREQEHAPRTRKPLSEFIFRGRWGNTALQFKSRR